MYNQHICGPNDEGYPAKITPSLNLLSAVYAKHGQRWPTGFAVPCPSLGRRETVLNWFDSSASLLRAGCEWLSEACGSDHNCRKARHSACKHFARIFTLIFLAGEDRVYVLCQAFLYAAHSAV